MWFQSRILIFSGHALLFEAREPEQPKLGAPDSIMDILDPDVFPLHTVGTFTQENSFQRIAEAALTRLAARLSRYSTLGSFLCISRIARLPAAARQAPWDGRAGRACWQRSVRRCLGGCAVAVDHP